MFGEMRVLLFFIYELEQVIAHGMAMVEVDQRQRYVRVEVAVGGHIQPYALVELMCSLLKRFIYCDPERLNCWVLVEGAIHVDAATVYLYLVLAGATDCQDAYRERT